MQKRLAIGRGVKVLDHKNRRGRGSTLIRPALICGFRSVKLGR